MRENTDQKNSRYLHFSCNVTVTIWKRCRPDTNRFYPLAIATKLSTLDLCVAPGQASTMHMLIDSSIIEKLFSSVFEKKLLLVTFFEKLFILNQILWREKWLNSICIMVTWNNFQRSALTKWLKNFNFGIKNH